MSFEPSLKTGRAAFDARDYATAALHLLPLAAAGETDALYYAAEMYRRGHGVEKNSDQAFRYYRAAADQGHAVGARDMGFFLLGGTSAEMDEIPADRVEAERYLALAVERFTEQASAGDDDAMCHLGFHYHSGFGVAMDGAEAARWYRASFDAGKVWAANGLCLVYYEGDPKVRDKVKARYWFDKANEFNCRSIGVREFENTVIDDAVRET